MPSTQPCLPCGPNPVVTNVPGIQGTPGNPGQNGSNGVNAFTTTQATFVVPDVGGFVVVYVGTNAFMAVNQLLMITDGNTTGIFKVIGTGNNPPNAIFLYISDPINTQSGNTMASNAAVVPAGANGSFPTLLPIANGGTGAVSKGAAQIALGLGRDSTISSVTGQTQAIIASPTQIGSISAVAPAAGRYLVEGFFSVDWAGFTTAASKVITGLLKNITASVTYGAAIIDTQILSGATFPTTHYTIPAQVVTLSQNDNIQILISIANLTGVSGTITTTQATIVLTPLALT